MSLESLLGGQKTTTAVDPGLQPNKFALQMFGPGSTPRPAIGFDKPALRDQIPAGVQTAAPAAPGAPAAPAAKDMWSDLGPLGAFFRLIDESQKKRGLPSVSGGNPVTNPYPNASGN